MSRHAKSKIGFLGGFSHHVVLVAEPAANGCFDGCVGAVAVADVALVEPELKFGQAATLPHLKQVAELVEDSSKPLPMGRVLEVLKQ